MATAAITPRATLTGHDDAVEQLAIAPDGTWLVTASWYTARIWSSDGAPRATLAGHNGPVEQVVIAPDGSWLAATSADTYLGRRRHPRGSIGRFLAKRLIDSSRVAGQRDLTFVRLVRTRLALLILAGCLTAAKASARCRIDNASRSARESL